MWLRSQAAALGQPTFSPASVFNFFPPDFDLPDDASLARWFGVGAADLGALFLHLANFSQPGPAYFWLTAVLTGQWPVSR